MNAASSLRDALTKINTWFSRPLLGQDSIDIIVNDCYGITARYWQTEDEMETRIRRDIIKKHISLRLKMWIDGREF